MGLFLINLFPLPANGQQKPQDLREWLQCVKEVSEKYGQDPNEMLAVAEVEGSKHGQRWWFGKVGRYYLPWGVHQYVVKERNLPVWDWRVQTEVAIRALAHHKNRRGNLIGALRKYNSSCDRNYINRVLSLTKQNRKEGVFVLGK